MIVFNNKLYKFKFYIILFFYKIVKYIIGINLNGIEIWKILCKIIIIIDVKGLLVILFI